MTDNLFREYRARAPLRLGFGGGGTDVSPYCDQYGGLVLNATINRFAFASATPHPAGLISFEAKDLGVCWEGSFSDIDNVPGKLTLLSGVYKRLVADYNSGVPVPMRLVTHADAPAGSGLGTSSSLVVALVDCLRSAMGIPLGTYDVAHLAFEIERIDLGLSGGRQDQYAAAFGGVNFLEFYEDERVIVNPLRIDRRTLNELESSLVIYFTGVSRSSAAIIEKQSSNIQKNKVSSIEALHSLKADAVKMKEALLRGQVTRLAELLAHSWADKKRISASITSPGIDEAYECAMANGALGGKVSGAGGGGFMMFLVRPELRPQFLTAMAACGGRAETVTLTEKGVESWRV